MYTMSSKLNLYTFDTVSLNTFRVLQDVNNVTFIMYEEDGPDPAENYLQVSGGNLAGFRILAWVL